MEVGNKSICDGQFCGNILVIGKTGKTYFIQKLGLNKFFGKSVKAEGVTGIEADEQREAEIQSCFINKVEFHLAIELDELVSLIQQFKLRNIDTKNNENISVFAEKIFMDHLIVMDNVSGIADNCKNFAEFLTVCRKYRYRSIYVFHITAPESQIWKKSLGQTNIFNIFPSSVPYKNSSE